MNSLMKKAWVFLFFLVLAGTSLVANPQNRSIFIEGTAERSDQHAFFMDNFRMEAVALGYAVTDFIWDAGYNFRFEVTPNVPPDDFEYNIQITFFRNEDNAELVSFGFLFTELEEMYEFNQLLFFRAAVNIPPIVPETGGFAGGTYQSDAPPPVYQGDTASYNQSSVVIIPPENDEWRNKWLYFRLSVDIPITFYSLKGEGQDDKKADALPGGTFGVEAQVLNWLSIEPIFQVGLEKFNNKNKIIMSAGAEIKFPFKFSGIMLEPYGAVSYPIVVPKEVFESFPLGFGGGLQLGIKGGKSGAFFLDVNFMYYNGDTKIYPDKELYPDAVTRYQRYVIGLGIGYKFGLFNRK